MQLKLPIDPEANAHADFPEQLLLPIVPEARKQAKSSRHEESPIEDPSTFIGCNSPPVSLGDITGSLIYVVGIGVVSRGARV